MSLAVYALAAVGVAIGVVGDVACVQAARGSSPLLLILAAVLFGLSSPVWYAMSRATGGGYVEPGVAWAVLACGASLGAALWSGDRQTTGQWVGYALVLLGAAVRVAAAPR